MQLHKAICNITQGFPAHLFLDLEYLLAYNPGRKPDRMVDTLVDLVNERFELEFGCRAHKEDIVEVDALCRQAQ